MADNYSELENKENSLEQVLKLAGLPSKFKLRAEEFNMVRAKLNDLKFLIDNLVLNSGGISGINIMVQPYTLSNDVDSYANYINTASATTVDAGKIVKFKFYIIDVSNNVTTTKVFSLRGQQEGIYGVGGSRILQDDDLLLDFERTSTADELAEVDGAQIVTFPNISGNIENWLTGQNPPLTLQPESSGIVVFRGTILNEPTSYLFVGPRGDYGVGAQTAFADYFEPLKESSYDSISITDIIEIPNRSFLDLQNKPKGEVFNFTVIEGSTYPNPLSRINSSSPFKPLYTASALLVVRTLKSDFSFKNEKIYKLVDQESRFFGSGTTALKSADVQLINVKTPTSESIEGLEDTVTIDFGEITTSIRQAINTSPTPIELNATSQNFSVLKGSVNGVLISYFYKGNGGTFGDGQVDTMLLSNLELLEQEATIPRFQRIIDVEGTSFFAIFPSDIEMFANATEFGFLNLLLGNEIIFHADGRLSIDSNKLQFLNSQPVHKGKILRVDSNGFWVIDDENESLWEVIQENPYNLKVPTEAEWQIEQSSWSTLDDAGAFNSPLKLTQAGKRDTNGTISFVQGGSYWTSTVSGDNAMNANFNTNGGGVFSNIRGNGFSIRLIVDGTFTQTQFDNSYLNETIIVNGLEYKFVYNPTTQKIWLDRNLGATQVAISSTDNDAYGDLFQWGRYADGHEKRTSGTLNEQASTPQPSHGDFITGFTDWVTPKNDNLWQGISGINNPAVNEKLLGKNNKKASYKDLADKPITSEENYTSTEKNKLAGIEVGAEVNNFSNSGNTITEFWSGTQAEYDAIGTKSATTFYFIE